MRIGLLRTDEVDSTAVSRIQETLTATFPETKCVLITETFTVPEEAFDSRRKQYRSNAILERVQEYAEQKNLNRVLVIVDVDISAPSLSFVFGEAKCPGKAALISLFRLKPEFYGQRSEPELFVERGEKEAVHELGHTFGLEHCSNPFCVMYFSNSTFDTDRKQSLFCDKCQRKIDGIRDTLG